jgi:riboflavin kinase / FMN adenylyltransferase
MEFYDGLDAVPRGFGPSAVTVGKFDGIHLGHRGVFAQLCARAEAAGLVPTVVTFVRIPLSIVRPDRVPPALVSPAQQAELLEDAGIAVTVILAFTPKFAALSPEQFVRQVLVDALDTKLVLAGADFRFGENGTGDLESLREFGATYGFAVELIDDVNRFDMNSDDGGVDRRLSSTWIRELLAAGRVREASDLLGRAPTIRSRVVHGEGRGRDLGYPTANLDPEIEGLLPDDGVYAAWAMVDGTRYGAAVSIGNNPTFDGIPQHQVEAHLLDQKLDLYGSTIELGFVDRVRSMQKFESVDALVTQLQADEVRIREILAAAG